MKWKEITSSLHADVRKSHASKVLLNDNGRGTWIPVGSVLEKEGVISLKELRKWLWERRACRILKRKSVALWGIQDSGRSYYGFAVRTDGKILDRWMSLGGPTL